MARRRSKKTHVAHFMIKNNKSQVKTNLKVPISVIYTYPNFRPPTDREQCLELLKEFVEWSFITPSTNPIDFPIEKRINPHHFFKVAEREELFADIIEYVKYIFASKLEKNPVVSPSYTTSRIRYYDKEYAQWVRQEILKTMEGRGVTNVVMTAIPTSNLVPERNKE